MTREQAVQIWMHARYIFAQSRLHDVRRKAKAIASEIEKAFGPINTPASEFWDE